MRADHSDIYEQFIQSCPGVQLPGDWDYLHGDENCRFVTDGTDEVVEILQQEFETDRLLESRLLVRAEDEQIGLNTRLLTEDQLFFVLRNEQGEIFDMITSAGSLSGRNVLVLLRKDAVTKHALQSHKRIFLVFSMVDALLFRALGLAAMPAADAIHLDRHGLQRLLWLVGGFSNGPIPRKQTQYSWEGRLMVNESGYVGSEEDTPHEFEMVICAFSLNSLSRKIPEGIAPVARHLAHAEMHLEIHFDDLVVWWPTEHEISNVEYRNKLQDAALLRDYVTVHGPGIDLGEIC